MDTRYILLPRGGLKASDGPSKTALRSIFESANRLGLGVTAQFEALSDRPMTVLDSTREDGPKLVTLDDATADVINRTPGPLRAVPEVIYELPRDALSAVLAPIAGAAITFTVRCVDARTGAGLSGVKVVAFDNYIAGTGFSAITDGTGAAGLRLPPGNIDRLYVLSPAGYWGGYRAATPVANITVALEPLAIGYTDAIRALYPTSRFVPATGVQVGVLDTGVGPHNEINLVGGECTVTGKPPLDYRDIQEHGTHVSGLVGGRGQAGIGVRGIAPGVKIFGYRVFDFYGSKVGASNYSILKAMIRAQKQGIDILNLSLGGGPRDAIVEESIIDARESGMLVVIAAGNDHRHPVSYPAAYPGATAVSAMGRTGTFPNGSMDDANVSRPPHNVNDPDDFIAAFSNVGPQIACTGLGVGVLSTLPNNGFGPMSGTSMAAPMVAGCVASLLSQNAGVFSMARDRQRSDAIERLLLLNCVKRFNDPTFEGYGLPDPARV